MAGLPALLHASCRLCRSSVSWTVAVWTATFLPQASSGWAPAGLPFLAPHWVPALEWLTMVTCCVRASLMVNDDTPNSYLPDWRPGMMASNLAGWYSVFRPSLAATALDRSRFQP